MFIGFPAFLIASPGQPLFVYVCLRTYLDIKVKTVGTPEPSQIVPLCVGVRQFEGIHGNTVSVEPPHIYLSLSLSHLCNHRLTGRSLPAQCCPCLVPVTLMQYVCFSHPTHKGENEHEESLLKNLCKGMG